MDLKTPLSERDVRRLKVGDVIYLSGIIFTSRDKAHSRVVHDNETLPIDAKGLAVYHCGPIVRKDGKRWNIISAGPTTSSRLENMESDFIRSTGIRMIIGKGGMGEKTTKACMEYGVVYCSFTGGASLVGADCIKRVKDVFWLDMGIPEAVWVFEVSRFGPLVVSIDSKGNNLYEDVRRRARTRV